MSNFYWNSVNKTFINNVKYQEGFEVNKQNESDPCDGKEEMTSKKSFSHIKTGESLEEVLNEIDLMTEGAQAKSMTCPPPLVLFENVIIPQDRSNTTEAQTQLIPKIFHFSYKSRCLPRDLARHLDRWKESFPSYSIFFHDDDAVDKLISQDWPEFPQLQKSMRCVLFKGAMKIDLWRVLVLYRYGGVYSDIDVMPRMDETWVQPKISAQFVEDVWGRPSQWLMAAEPYHPLFWMTMERITKQILELDNIHKPKLVFVTGPEAVKSSYIRYLSFHLVNMPERGLDAKVKLLQKDVPMEGLDGKLVMISGKKKQNAIVKQGYGDIVAFNSTLNVTRGERIRMDGGVVHWQKAWVKFHLPKKYYSCKAYLSAIDSGEIEEIQQVSRR